MNITDYTEEHLKVAVEKCYRMRNEITDTNAEAVFNYISRVLELNESFGFLKRIHENDELQLTRTYYMLEKRLERLERERKGE